MDDLELIRNKNEFEISIKSFNGEMEACQEKAHMQFRHKIMVPYDPHYGEVVGEKCLGCKMVYQRPPTKQEVEQYYGNSKQQSFVNSFYSSEPALLLPLIIQHPGK